MVGPFYTRDASAVEWAERVVEKYVRRFSGAARNALQALANGFEPMGREVAALKEVLVNAPRELVDAVRMLVSYHGLNPASAFDSAYRGRDMEQGEREAWRDMEVAEGAIQELRRWFYQNAEDLWPRVGQELADDIRVISSRARQKTRPMEPNAAKALLRSTEILRSEPEFREVLRRESIPKRALANAVSSLNRLAYPYEQGRGRDGYQGRDNRDPNWRHYAPPPPEFDVQEERQRIRRAIDALNTAHRILQEDRWSGEGTMAIRKIEPVIALTRYVDAGQHPAV